MMALDSYAEKGMLPCRYKLVANICGLHPSEKLINTINKTTSDPQPLILVSQI